NEPVSVYRDRESELVVGGGCVQDELLFLHPAPASANESKGRALPNSGLCLSGGGVVPGCAYQHSVVTNSHREAEAHAGRRRDVGLNLLEGSPCYVVA